MALLDLWDAISPTPNPASDSGYSVDYPEKRAEGFPVTVFVGEELATRL